MRSTCARRKMDGHLLSWHVVEPFDNSDNWPYFDSAVKLSQPCCFVVLLDSAAEYRPADSDLHDYFISCICPAGGFHILMRHDYWCWRNVDV